MKEILVDMDDGARPTTTMESLAKLKPAFQKGGSTTAGNSSQIMGVGPAYAIPAALAKSGCSINDMDVFEINEAFASQACYCVKKLGVPKEKLNPRGGAIACGHPLGMTGARMIVTLFSELERTNKKRGLVSMCIGTGMGACGVFERE